MEINDFAEQILFGNTLEDKLKKMDSISDLKEIGSFNTPKIPTRPTNLYFSEERNKNFLKNFFVYDFIII